jgi:hypothetical protein
MAESYMRSEYFMPSNVAEAVSGPRPVEPRGRLPSARALMAYLSQFGHSAVDVQLFDMEGEYLFEERILDDMDARGFESCAAYYHAAREDPAGPWGFFIRGLSPVRVPYPFWRDMLGESRCLCGMCAKCRTCGAAALKSRQACAFCAEASAAVAPRVAPVRRSSEDSVCSAGCSCSTDTLDDGMESVRRLALGPASTRCSDGYTYADCDSASGTGAGAPPNTPLTTLSSPA